MTEEDLEKLFGNGYKLTIAKELSVNRFYNKESHLKNEMALTYWMFEKHFCLIVFAVILK